MAIATEPCGTAMVSLVVMQFGTPAMLEWPLWGALEILHLALGISKQPFWFWADKHLAGIKKLEFIV